jgi:hypothetical protein
MSTDDTYQFRRAKEQVFMIYKKTQTLVRE